MGHGNREVLQNLLLPFKAAVDLAAVQGVMMSYNELDDVPAHVNPMLYDALDEWGFDGIVIADDTGECIRIGPCFQNSELIRLRRSFLVDGCSQGLPRFAGYHRSVVQRGWHGLLL